MDCVKFFKGKMEKMAEVGGEDLRIEDILRKGFDELVKLPGWANARDVEAAWEAAKRIRADRIVEHNLLDSTAKGARNFAESDIHQAVEEMVKSRKTAEGKKSKTKPPCQIDDFKTMLLNMPEAAIAQLGLSSPSNSSQAGLLPTE